MQSPSEKALEFRKSEYRFFEGVTILVVDDSQEDILFITEGLACTKWQIIGANKIYGLGILNDIDFALIDFNLKNGFDGDVLGQFCKNQGIPYAYLSGADEPEHCQDKNALWLRKNIESDKLVEIIKQQLTKKGKTA